MFSLIQKKEVNASHVGMFCRPATPPSIESKKPKHPQGRIKVRDELCRKLGHAMSMFSAEFPLCHLMFTFSAVAQRAFERFTEELPERFLQIWGQLQVFACGAW